MRKKALLLALPLMLLPRLLSSGVERIGGELLLSGSGALFPSAPAAAFARDGSFVAVWVEQDRGGSGFVSVARRFDGRGTPLGDAFTIGESAPDASPGPPQIVSRSGGGFAVAWPLVEGRDKGARVRLLGPDGVPEGGAIEVRPRVPGESVFLDPGRSWLTATADGELLLVWDSEWMFSLIEGQRLSAQGRPIGERLVVNTGTGAVRHASVAPTASGGFVIAWAHFDPLVARESGAMVRPYGARKQPLSLEIPVSRDEIKVTVRTPAVAARPDGTFMVIAGRTRATRDLGLTLRVFTENGVPLGREARVDAGGREVFGGPVAASGPGGHVVIVWEQFDRGSASGIDVLARVVEPDGDFTGPPFVVNSRTASSQVGAAVATGAAGEAVVVWVDNPEQGDWTIRGQLFRLTR